MINVLFTPRFPEVSMDFSDAPGGDISLDDIFGENPSTPTTVEPTQVTPQSTQTTTPDEPFLKAKTGSVYKTREDAITGIERKDELIAELRSQLEQRTGQDPLRKQPQPQQPTSYLEDQEKYFADIARAVERKDTKSYMDAQTKLIYDALAPLGPALTGLSRANAERVVAERLPEFKGFLGSESYRNVVKDAPLLGQAIAAAEGNPAASGQLPELYEVAYLASLGRRVPELVQAAKAEATPQVTPRPTVHSSPVPPPATSGTPVASPSLDTRAGRKALIEQYEGRGIGDLKW